MTVILCNGLHICELVNDANLGRQLSDDSGHSAIVGVRGLDPQLTDEIGSHHGDDSHGHEDGQVNNGPHFVDGSRQCRDEVSPSRAIENLLSRG